MAAGVTDRLWDVADLVAAWKTEERRGGKSGVSSGWTPNPLVQQTLPPGTIENAFYAPDGHNDKGKHAECK